MEYLEGIHNLPFIGGPVIVGPVFIDRQVFITIGQGDLRLRKIREAILLKDMIIRCYLCKFMIFSAAGSVVIHQAKEKLLFSAQHASPGPCQDHLCPVSKAQERVHPEDSRFPRIASEISSLELDTPHGLIQFRQSVFIDHQCIYKWIFILRIEIRVKSHAGVIHKFPAALKIIESQRISLGHMIAGMHHSGSFLLHHILQLYHKFQDAVPEKSSHLQIGFWSAL